MVVVEDEGRRLTAFVEDVGALQAGISLIKLPWRIVGDNFFYADVFIRFTIPVSSTVSSAFLVPLFHCSFLLISPAKQPLHITLMPTWLSDSPILSRLQCPQLFLFSFFIVLFFNNFSS